MPDNVNILENEVPPSPTDPLICWANGRPNGLYYYYLEKDLYGNTFDNTSVLGTTNAIANISYVPFLNLTKDNLKKISYDTDRYGDIGGRTGRPLVFRVYTDNKPLKMPLIEADIYPTLTQAPLGTARNSALYESKLYDYPYRTIIFSSNVFDKYEVIPYLAENSVLENSSNGKALLEATTPISPGGNFYVNVKGYKGTDHLERYFVLGSMDMPNTSSAYSNFMSSQKARTAVSIGSQIESAKLSTISSSVGILSGAVSGAGSGSTIGSAFGIPGIAVGGVVGGIAGAIKGGGVGLAQSQISRQTAVSEGLAIKHDLLSTPNALTSMGSDISVRIGEDTTAVVNVSELVITNDYKVKIGDYFAMYGYKQNRMMGINLRSRHYYNYIKTYDCNLISQPNISVPKKYIEGIKAVFNKGATFWHLDRNGGKYCDYEFDNREVKTI